MHIDHNTFDIALHIAHYTLQNTLWHGPYAQCNWEKDPKPECPAIILKKIGQNGALSFKLKNDYLKNILKKSNFELWTWIFWSYFVKYSA